MQGPSACGFLKGRALGPCAGRRSPAVPARLVVRAAGTLELDERLRLNNLSPQPGSRTKNKRKGRGYGAGQGGSCGFGMRGQNSRSGSGTRPGFEGGQTPLYRQIPKLKGIAGGMRAGVAKYITINLGDLDVFGKDEEVSLETLQQKKLLNVSGREAKLPLKVLGEGELQHPLTIKATAYSSSARTKIEAAGGQIVEVPKRIVWTKALGKERKAAAAAEAASKQPAATDTSTKRSPKKK